jgi:hypothetical protein
MVPRTAALTDTQTWKISMKFAVLFWIHHFYNFENDAANLEVNGTPVFK